MRNLLHRLQAHKLAFPFLTPVDWNSLTLPSYPSIIKKPMDLSTVAKKLENDKYKRVEKFFADLYLIWDNCQTFNSP